MAALTETWVNMHPYGHPYDALYSNLSSYPGATSQAPSTQESAYAFHPTSVDPGEVPPDGYLSSTCMTSSDPHPSIAVSSYPHSGPYEESYQTMASLPPEGLKQAQYIDYQTHSPPAVTRTTDPAMTGLAQVSGPSVASTSSSTLGSPNSAVSRPLARSDPWANSHFERGLGLVSGAVTTEGFTQENPITVGLGPENTFVDEKMPTGYVSKYDDVSSPTDAVQDISVSSSFSSSPSLVPAFASHSIYSIGPHDSGLTINTVLEDIAGGLSASPASATSTVRAPVGDDGVVFRSPVSPALARSSRTRRSMDATATRWHPYSHPARNLSKSTTPNASPSPATNPVSPPNVSISSGLPEGLDLHRSPFFTQSSGHFVVPLQTSCWFPSDPCSGPSVPSSPLSLSLPRQSSRLVESQRLTRQPPLDPSLIEPFHTPTMHSPTTVPQVGEMPELQPPHLPAQHSRSPEPSRSSPLAVQRRGSAHIKSGNQTPYLRTRTYQPYAPGRRNSTPSHLPLMGSPATGSGDSDGDESKLKGRCPHPECGRVFRDLKSHLLSHQAERPEKCPIVTCDYHHKGFARKYDRNRHTLTHYKGTMVCGFCPGSGSVAEKSFNRADVFKRHLMSVHHVEQTPPNSRKKSSAGVVSETRRSASFPRDVTGKCSTCSDTFDNAQDFYEHLDDCVLRVVQQEDPGEAINERHLASMNHDEAVFETFRGHALLTDAESTVPAPDALGFGALNKGDDEEQARERIPLATWAQDPTSYEPHSGQANPETAQKPQ